MRFDGFAPLGCLLIGNEPSPPGVAVAGFLVSGWARDKVELSE